jgi:hypothetical protein
MLAAGGVAALLAVAGCTDSDDADKAKLAAGAGAAAAAGPPMISEADAKAVLARITAANNKANAALDPAQVGGFEAEAGLASDTAALQSYVGREIGEFDYELERLLAPSATAGADFFVADAVTGSATQHFPLVLARAGQDWKVVHNAPLEVPLPDLRRGGAGSVEVVGADDPGATLIASPKQVAEAHAAALDQAATSGPFAGDTVSAKIAGAEQAREEIGFTDGQTPESFTSKSAVEKFPVRALRTADGGALVAYATRSVFTATGAGLEADLGPGLTKLGGRTGTGKVTLEMLSMWWTQVPAKGKGDKVTVLGGTNQAVDIG